MDRFIVGTSSSTSVTFYQDGVVVDPGTVTLAITREDGTSVATGQATTGSGATARTFALTAAHLAQLDILRLDWTSVTKGTLTTYAEVCGGFLASVADLRATPPLSDTTKYPTASLLAYRTLAETALEDACGVAFIPRYFHGRVDGTGTVDVLACDSERGGVVRPLTITSAVVGASSSSAGTTLTSDQLSDIECYVDGRVYNPSGWTEGRRNVELKGSRGYTFPPPRVGLAVCKLVKRWLVDNPISDRATSVTNADGGFTRMLTAGMRDNVFDVPECLVVVNLYGVNNGVA